MLDGVPSLDALLLGLGPHLQLLLEPLSPEHRSRIGPFLFLTQHCLSDWVGWGVGVTIGGGVGLRRLSCGSRGAGW